MPESKSLLLPDPGNPINYLPKSDYILAIGIDDYLHCNPLQNSVRDAEAFIKVLTESYGFEEKHVFRCFNKQATRKGITDAFFAMKKKLGKSDNLIIYYSGHGYFNSEYGWGYWIPIESDPLDESSFIHNRMIIEFIKKFPCHHLVLISDSCFSGSFFDSAKDATKALSEYPSRWAITSGRKQKVLDGEPGIGSPFSQYLVRFLEENVETLQVSDLGFRLKVSINADTELYQTPRAEPLQIKGHEGGEYVFRRRVNENKFWDQVLNSNSISSYSEYIKFFPKGKNVEEAYLAIAELEESLDYYKQYLKDFPTGKYRE